MEGAVLNSPPTSPTVDRGVPTHAHIHFPFPAVPMVGECHFLIIWPGLLGGVVIGDADYRGNHLPPHCGVVDGQQSDGVKALGVCEQVIVAVHRHLQEPHFVLGANTRKITKYHDQIRMRREERVGEYEAWEGGGNEEGWEGEGTLKMYLHAECSDLLAAKFLQI